MKSLFLFAAIGLFCTTLGAADQTPPAAEAGHRIFTKDGDPSDPAFFPLAVWLQSPRNAARYRAMGIDLYVGLYDGPTAGDLAELEKVGMPVICDQNAVGLENKDQPIIAGWMHGDEPDNAQSLGKGKGYGPPVAPEKIEDEYTHMKAADPTRPVMLNLGQGVAWDNYIGRGVRTHHPEDYAEYVKGSDIVSFDIYPVVHDSPEVAGKLEFVAHGVERLVDWTKGRKRVWNCIECTHIGNAKALPTPQQVRAEVWMGLIRGSRGIIYFVHQFAPSFKEAAVLDDPQMVGAITEINRQIRELAPILNSPTVADGLEVQSPDSSVVAICKQSGDSKYVLAVNLRNQPARAVFSLRGVAGRAADVLGEARNLALESGSFADDFPSYGMHLYRIATGAKAEN